MKHNDNVSERHVRMSYMDGELSGPDRVEYEKTLTSEQKKAIALDKTLQDGLVNCIKRVDRCPDRLLARVRAEIGCLKRPRRMWRIFPLSAVAACFVLGLSLLYVNYARSGPIEIQVSFPEDISQFAESATIKGDQKTIEEMLNANGFKITIADIATCNRQHRHRITLLGMNMLEIGDRKYPCAHLHFSCCRRPVSTYVVKESRRITPASFKTADVSGTVHKMVHHANGYLIVTMSHHATSVVGGLFEKPAPDIQE